mgnify:CR=1 FL=1
MLWRQGKLDDALTELSEAKKAEPRSVGTLVTLAAGALLAASVPALADHDRRDSRGRHVSHQVVVKHHHHTRRVVVERPV